MPATAASAWELLDLLVEGGSKLAFAEEPGMITLSALLGPAAIPARVSRPTFAEAAFDLYLEAELALHSHRGAY